RQTATATVSMGVGRKATRARFGGILPILPEQSLGLVSAVCPGNGRHRPREEGGAGGQVPLRPPRDHEQRNHDGGEEPRRVSPLQGQVAPGEVACKEEVIHVVEHFVHSLVLVSLPQEANPPKKPRNVYLCSGEYGLE